MPNRRRLEGVKRLLSGDGLSVDDEPCCWDCGGVQKRSVVRLSDGDKRERRREPDLWCGSTAAAFECALYEEIGVLGVQGMPSGTGVTKGEPKNGL